MGWGVRHTSELDMRYEHLVPQNKLKIRISIYIHGNIFLNTYKYSRVKFYAYSHKKVIVHLHSSVYHCKSEHGKVLQDPIGEFVKCFYYLLSEGSTCLRLSVRRCD